MCREIRFGRRRNWGLTDILAYFSPFCHVFRVCSFACVLLRLFWSGVVAVWCGGGVVDVVWMLQGYLSPSPSLPPSPSSVLPSNSSLLLFFLVSWFLSVFRLIFVVFPYYLHVSSSCLRFPRYLPLPLSPSFLPFLLFVFSCLSLLNFSRICVHFSLFIVFFLLSLFPSLFTSPSHILPSTSSFLSCVSHFFVFIFGCTMFLFRTII